MLVFCVTVGECSQNYGQGWFNGWLDPCSLSTTCHFSISLSPHTFILLYLFTPFLCRLSFITCAVHQAFITLDDHTWFRTFSLTFDCWLCCAVGSIVSGMFCLLYSVIWLMVFWVKWVLVSLKTFEFSSQTSSSCNIGFSKPKSVASKYYAHVFGWTPNKQWLWLLGFGIALWEQ